MEKGAIWMRGRYPHWVASHVEATLLRPLRIACSLNESAPQRGTAVLLLYCRVLLQVPWNMLIPLSKFKLSSAATGQRDYCAVVPQQSISQPGGEGQQVGQ